MSVLPWSSTLPSSWPVARLKHVCHFVGGGTPDTGNAEFWQGDIPWVSPKDMKSQTINDTEDHITEDGLKSSATKLVDPGAVLIVMRSGILRHSIPVAINRVPAALNQDMRAMVPDSRLEPKYLARLIEGHQTELLSAWSKEGATVESLESDLLGNTIIPIPPISKQRAIAYYLDRETARLDALIAAKQRILALMVEKRRALITRAVTRGLDPGAPVRDSGIAWLGDIPKHWNVIALRFLVGISSGATPDTGNPELWDGDIPWVSPKDMKRNEIGDAEDHITTKALSTGPLKLIEPGAVLIVVRGMILAHSFPTAVTTMPVTINQDMKALRCLGAVEPYFLRDYFRGTTSQLVSLADASAHGTRKLETEVLGRFEICVPPSAEQIVISNHIAKETTKLDALRAATERTIALILERRSALIAAAVTGQITLESPV